MTMKRLAALAVGLAILTGAWSARRRELHHHDRRLPPDGRQSALLGRQRRHGHRQPDAAGGSADALQDRKPRARHAARARPRRPQRRHGHLQGARHATTGRSSTRTCRRSCSAGMRPLMELSFMPTALAASGDNKNPPKRLHRLQGSSSRPSSSTAWTSTARTTWGSGTGRCGTSRTMPGSGTARSADYYALYDAAVDATPPCCPTSSSADRRRPSRARSRAFLQHCKSANKRVTFVSSHVYPGGATASRPRTPRPR